jgi:hypothetical protein
MYKKFEQELLLCYNITLTAVKKKIDVRAVITSRRSVRNSRSRANTSATSNVDACAIAVLWETVRDLLCMEFFIMFLIFSPIVFIS